MTGKELLAVSGVTNTFAAARTPTGFRQLVDSE